MSKHLDGPTITPFSLAGKYEPSDDQRNDSGVSECASVSPASTRSFSPAYQGQKSHQYADRWQRPCNLPPKSASPLSFSTPKSSSRTNRRKAPTNTNGIVSTKQPQLNSHGKLKSYNCKTCGVKSFTKEEHWTHIRIHIDKNKILTCGECPFATHLKHHFEFHYLSFHSGSKPFKCSLCDYACVNKSMLNSHLKSHSNNYPYRCGGCSYATKYLHTLKMHLQKTKHAQGVVLNADGSPNPYPIDVYGTRRGPKQKKTNKKLTIGPAQAQLSGKVNQFEQQSQAQAMPPFGALLGQVPLVPYSLTPQDIYRTQEMLLAHNIMMNLFNQHAAQNALAAPQQASCSKYQGEIGANGVLDLSNKPSTSAQGDDDEEMTMAFDNVEVVHHADPSLSSDDKMETEIQPESQASVFSCHHCNIDFKGKSGEFMYRIHMGQHGYNRPFTCNMCGEDCENVVSFTMHISKGVH